MIENTLPALDNSGQDSSKPPKMPFWQMRNTADGCSTIGLRLLQGFLPRSVSGDTTPIWMRAFPGAVKAVWFNILPVGWIGEWHPTPALQWVVPLSGHWYIETHDGKRVEMGPGDIHWGADLAGNTAASQEGHRSGQLGDVPCVQIMVQFVDTTDHDVATRSESTGSASS